MQVAEGRAVVVQVRSDPVSLLRFYTVGLDRGAQGYFISTRFSNSRIGEWLASLLLLAALIREKVWQYDAIHIHIAYPILMHVGLWRRLVGRPIMLSEHWSAYHFDFNLPPDSRALTRLRRPFSYGIPIFAVSRSLLSDIRRFARRDDFPAFVIPNVVPLHGASRTSNPNPVLFTVNRWVAIKDPMPMLEGLAISAASGEQFELVIGGSGEMSDKMITFVNNSALAKRTRFLGLMTKSEIAAQLHRTDGYIFSSHYETFSVSCAEALGAGVPLLGPELSAIAEYAGIDDWHRVEKRDANGWARATTEFLRRIKAGGFERSLIADRANRRFSSTAIRSAYRSALVTLLGEREGPRSNDQEA